MADFGGPSFESRYGPAVSVRDVLDLWMCLIVCESPWSTMYRDDLAGCCRPIIAALLDDGDDVTRAERRHQLTDAAHRHGQFRRGQRCGSRELMEEMSLLEEAVGEVLHRGGATPRRVEQTLRSLAPDFRRIGRA